MSVLGWIRQHLLARKVRREAVRLSEIQAALRRLRRGSPQLRPLVEKELGRTGELAKLLPRVRTGAELEQWRALLAMCLPAIQPLVSAAPPAGAARPRAGNRRSSGKRAVTARR